MAMHKKSALPAATSRQSGAGRAAAAAAPKPGNAARKAGAAPLVSRVTAGGFTVYGSPVQPKYRTTKQIAEAIAELD